MLKLIRDLETEAGAFGSGGNTERNTAEMSVVSTALHAAWMLLLLLLTAGDSTETDEDNRDDDESVCGEGEMSTTLTRRNQKRREKPLNNRRNKLLGKQWTCSVLWNRFKQLICQ